MSLSEGQTDIIFQSSYDNCGFENSNKITWDFLVQNNYLGL